MSEHNATHADAELILKLYDLRREAEMRKARNFFFQKFWPSSADDVLSLLRNFGSSENAYFRQVTGYWDMAAALVVRGALSETLFIETNGEMFGMYGKLRPFLKEIREKANSPYFLKNVEKVAENTPEGRDRVARTEQNLKRWAEMQMATAGRNGN
jgi:hypothetical protein